MTIADATPTAEEGIKRASRFLRGDLHQELGAADANFSADSEHLLKFHGIYAQDDRDVRRARSLAKEELDYIFMIRVAIPGGLVTSSQWLTFDRVSSELADESIRLTTRQAVQFHGVLKRGLRPLARELDAHLMTSFAACGDVVRNTVMCPVLVAEAGGDRRPAMAERIARTYKPATNAHWEIFVNGELAASREAPPEHPFYGVTYLPRKFKIAIAHPDENCVDVYAQDLGLVPVTHPELGEGFSVVVGGGLGRSYAQSETFARLGELLTFVTDDEVDELISAVLTTYRDLGDRSNRRRARLKYVVADLGPEAFRFEVGQRYGRELRAALPVAIGEADDHLGWRRSNDGRHQLGVRVGAGRVRDLAGGVRLRSALREVAQRFDVNFLITAQQDIIINSIGDEDRVGVAALLAIHGVRPVEDLGGVERSALACPALPTCGQALAEAERRLPELVDLIEHELVNIGGGTGRLQLRMTGCPNGCARPAVAEVGVVGRTKNTYDVYLGGGPRGDRLAVLHQEKVKLEDVPDVLRPVLERWGAEGRTGESFGDFYARTLVP